MTVSMAESGNANTLEWTRPDQVMQLHRMKLKKRALQARINKTNIDKNDVQHIDTNLDRFNSSNSALRPVSQKRKNPFAINESCKKQKDITPTGLEISNDNTLFELLNIDVQQKKQTTDSSTDKSLSFANVLSKLESINQTPDAHISKGSKHIPIDWTLKTKMRFMSLKPFPWNGKLKTSEEASGTTGFVRCLNIGEKETTLDTSPNARFHQCCLIWQHPSLPWLELFPRSAGKVSTNLASNTAIANNSCIKDALYREWCDSFRSLFHLLRARQCPYFYMCANTFTVLFRAAGICGLSEIHALLTPTTRGFRQSLRQEEIEYSMPLRKDSKRRSDPADFDSNTVDTTSHAETADRRQEGDEDEEDEDEMQDAWLESLGIDNSEIRKINHSQARMTLEKESEIDNLKQSLVFVKGVETQALFNFLINCKSAIAVTGALAGVPPTLLAPTAFHGATLKPLKVRENVVRVDNDKYFSLELNGPLLPHVLPSLCYLMKSSQLEQYSASCAQLTSTIPFSVAKHGTGQANFTKGEDCNATKVPLNVFGQENLSDCGFNEELLSHFCSSDPARIEILESFKFFNGLYTWS
ncbi:protein downstream neighbor of son homolog isoform X2 [Linepithema humile]|nr:PREDICTED: protein downstream neighbor of son homolog isoform X2 [Linepithema humile]XP_012214885.1 PREDICTED: protein downstream neighbor of son homolog isoform X2 [Linepithema humile]XP_012214886.1 PREDICTED: protein downstream neighbor of son homolog isoform X2 [Linepithema humile]